MAGTYLQWWSPCVHQRGFTCKTCAEAGVWKGLVARQYNCSWGLALCFCEGLFPGGVVQDSRQPEAFVPQYGLWVLIGEDPLLGKLE